MLLWRSPLYYWVICKSISFTDITESSDLEFPKRQLAALPCYCLKLIYSLNEGRAIWSTTSSPQIFPCLLFQTDSGHHAVFCSHPWLRHREAMNLSLPFLQITISSNHSPLFCEFSLQNHLQSFYYLVCHQPISRDISYLSESIILQLIVYNTVITFW